MSLSLQDTAHIAFHNLLLLGFDPEDVLKKSGVHIDIDSLMHAPGNIKGMENMMHFLILKAFPSEAGQAFKLLWPIVDKTQSRDFRKFVGEKLVAMQRDKLISALPIVRATMIDQPFGAKYCTVLLNITSFVMRRQLASWKQPAPVFPPFQAKHKDSLLRIARMRLKVEQENFFHLLEHAHASQDRWKEFSDQWSARYNDAVSEREKINAQLLELGLSGKPADVSKSQKELDDTEKLVFRMWSLVDAFENESEEGRKAVDSIWLEKGERPSINLEQLAAEKNVDLRTLGDRVDLESLLQRWAACISQLNRQLAQHPEGREGMRRIATASESVKDVTMRNAENLRRVQGLRAALEQDLTVIEEALPALRAAAYAHQPPASLSLPSVSLHSLVPSPPPPPSEQAREAPPASDGAAATAASVYAAALTPLRLGPAHAPSSPPPAAHVEQEEEEEAASRLALRFAGGGRRDAGGAGAVDLPPSRLPAPKISSAAGRGVPKGREISELDQRMLLLRMKLREQAAPSDPAPSESPPASPPPLDPAPLSSSLPTLPLPPSLPTAPPSSAPHSLPPPAQESPAAPLRPLSDQGGAAATDRCQSTSGAQPDRGGAAHVRQGMIPAVMTITPAPAQGAQEGGMSELERRRAALRAKLEGARQDPLLAGQGEGAGGGGEGVARQGGERAVC